MLMSIGYKNLVPLIRGRLSGPAVCAQRTQSRYFSQYMEVTKETRQKNLVTAGLCAAFVTGVWYYSVSAVGGGSEQRDELEEAISEEEIKINVHQSGQLRANNKLTAESTEVTPVEGKKNGGRGWQFWKKSPKE